MVSNNYGNTVSNTLYPKYHLYPLWYFAVCTKSPNSKVCQAGPRGTPKETEMQKCLAILGKERTQVVPQFCQQREETHVFELNYRKIMPQGKGVGSEGGPCRYQAFWLRTDNRKTS